MKTVNIFLLMAFLFIVSCNSDKPDEEDYSVIEPGSYFPVYPGSWWKYAVNDTLIITDSTAHDYVLHNYVDYYDNDSPVYSDKYYVPYYYSSSHSPMGITGPIYRYDKVVVTIQPQGNSLWPILREQTGAFTAVPVDNHVSVYETITVNEKYFNGQDSVLVLVGRANLDVADIHIREFYKDIGIARDYYIDPISNDTTYKAILVDYHISK
jgi:hypothetical protein